MVTESQQQGSRRKNENTYFMYIKLYLFIGKRRCINLTGHLLGSSLKSGRENTHTGLFTRSTRERLDRERKCWESRGRKSVSGWHTCYMGLHGRADTSGE